MAGKSWQPSHKPPCEREREQEFVTQFDKTVERSWGKKGRGKGGGSL